MARQDVYATQSELERAARECSYYLRHLSSEQISQLNRAYPVRKSSAKIMNDQVFWRELGFDSAVSISAHHSNEMVSDFATAKLPLCANDFREVDRGEGMRVEGAEMQTG
jgi:hypothetical protein